MGDLRAIANHLLDVGEVNDVCLCDDGSGGSCFLTIGHAQEVFEVNFLVERVTLERAATRNGEVEVDVGASKLV